MLTESINAVNPVLLLRAPVSIQTTGMALLVIFFLSLPPTAAPLWVIRLRRIRWKTSLPQIEERSGPWSGVRSMSNEWLLSELEMNAVHGTRPAFSPVAACAAFDTSCLFGEHMRCVWWPHQPPSHDFFPPSFLLLLALYSITIIFQCPFHYLDWNGDGDRGWYNSPPDFLPLSFSHRAFFVNARLVLCWEMIFLYRFILLIYRSYFCVWKKVRDAELGRGETVSKARRKLIDLYAQLKNSIGSQKRENRQVSIETLKRQRDVRLVKCRILPSSLDSWSCYFTSFTKVSFALFFCIIYFWKEGCVIKLELFNGGDGGLDSSKLARCISWINPQCNIHDVQSVSDIAWMARIHHLHFNELDISWARHVNNSIRLFIPLPTSSF